MNRLIAVILVNLLVLVGCGQKGPLYLPQASDYAKQIENPLAKSRSGSL